MQQCSTQQAHISDSPTTHRTSEEGRRGIQLQLALFQAMPATTWVICCCSLQIVTPPLAQALVAELATDNTATAQDVDRLSLSMQVGP
jgi:hypothetical protein